LGLARLARQRWPVARRPRAARSALENRLHFLMSDWIHRIVAPSAIVVSAGAIPCYATTYLTVEQAQKICFPDATQFVSADVTLTREQLKAVEKDSGVNARRATQKVWRAVAGEKVLG